MSTDPRLHDYVEESSRNVSKHEHAWEPVYDLPRRDGDEPVGRVCRGCLRYEERVS